MEYQSKVLEILSGKLGNFYLAGGTALERFYFNHRNSEDLDFFVQSKNFSSIKVNLIIDEIKEKLKFDVKLVEEINEKGKARIMIFFLKCGGKDVLKIDFVEDFTELISGLNTINGIPVLSKEDIYLRKIYAVAGNIEEFDVIGRKSIKGGRQEPKDFFDLYFLSHTFCPLSDFVAKYCSRTTEEGLITWYRKYDRFVIKSGLIDLDTEIQIDYKDMEKHFKEQVDILIEREIS